MGRALFGCGKSEVRSGTHVLDDKSLLRRVCFVLLSLSSVLFQYCLTHIHVRSGIHATNLSTKHTNPFLTNSGR